MAPRIESSYFYNEDNESDTESEEDVYDSILAYEGINDYTQDECEEVMDEKYYIGGYYIENKKELILTSRVKPSTVFNYDITDVTDYIRIHSSLQMRDDLQLDIMKVVINHQTTAYNVLLKTHWIRLIQRTWKKVYSRRKEMLHSTMFGLNRELGGQNMLLPSIYGMLYRIKYKKK